MQHVINTGRSWGIVYDASLKGEPGLDYFDVESWRSRRALTGEAVGRGSAFFIETEIGPIVLRHYLRGGWAAKISRRNYIFTGISRSRPFKEYHLLAQLHAQGLPVPRPVAALCRHRGIFSTGAIVTARIQDATTLADVMADRGLSEGVWVRIGKCIRRFHDAGVWHADLNARNILINGDSRVFLLDFDRARFSPGAAVKGEGNLRRLKRSLVKLWPANDVSGLHLAWAKLESGYGE